MAGSSVHGKRIAVLSSRRLGGHVNDLIHRGFFDYAVAMGAAVSWVGPGEDHDIGADELGDFVRERSVDLAIVNMKKRVASWLPADAIADLPCPKAIVEVDYCYEKGKGDSYYLEAKFDRVFFRGMVDYLESDLPGRAWLPFSVHPGWLCHPEDGDRFGVGFAGTVNPPDHYHMRRWALQALDRMVSQPSRKVTGEEYMRWWTQFVIGLTCSSKANYDNAKHVIIPAAGALLLTDGARGTAELLPSECWLRYTLDADALRGMVRDALCDQKGTMEKRVQAYEVVRALHTHRSRWDALMGAL